MSGLKVAHRIANHKQVYGISGWSLSELIHLNVIPHTFTETLRQTCDTLNSMTHAPVDLESTTPFPLLPL